MKQSIARPWQRVSTHVALLLMCGFSLLPFLWMVLTSLKPLREVEQDHLLPTVWMPQNYLEVFTRVPYAQYYFNSVFVAAWVTYLVVFTSAMAAYAFARIQWPGRDLVFRLYLTTLMIPGLVTTIPNFSLMVKLRLLDTYPGLIVPAAFSAFGTFLLRQFMLSLPQSLDEAAEIDGASPWTLFWTVTMPLSKAGLITLSLFTFMGSYGSFFWPLIMVKSDSLRTLPLGIMIFDSTYGRQTNLLMASSVMSIVPVVVLFVFGQRFFVKGLLLGAVKG